MPLQPLDIAPYLDELGLTAQWAVVQPTEDPMITQTSPVTQIPDGTILSGYAIDGSTVAFDVRPDGTDLPDHAGPRLSDIDCTEGQAAAWE